jgi:leucyl/phenylalanyl-tRNA--protein transferase
MVTIQQIERESLDFPATDKALNYPNGLLAVGGDLSVERLLQAYSRGIFPWYEEPQPILWWSPDPRSVLFPDELKVSKSLRKCMRRDHFEITADRVFHRVLSGCAAPRQQESGTWITNAMARAYMSLHRSGYAHSIEVWDKHKQLVGGLYGVALGEVFFGESMFSIEANASKTALVALVYQLRCSGQKLIDCQVESAHLNSMGARNITRLDFEQFLAQTEAQLPAPRGWQLEMSSGELL